MHKELYIVMESLRQGYDLLIKALPDFLSSSIEFVPRDLLFSAHICDFYLAMWVRLDACKLLAEFQAVFRDGKLEISEHVQGMPIMAVNSIFERLRL